MVATRESDAAAPVDGWVRVADLEELKRRGVVVVSGGRHGIAVFAHEDGVAAVDNRCPHMGFPLSRGTVCDGILTCHWHHARFDLSTGGTFDPFADDVAVHDVRVADGVVYVDPRPRVGADRAQRHLARLEDGLEQNLSLVLVKSVLALLGEGGAPEQILAKGALFGTLHRAAGWGPGLTIMTAMGNVLDRLSPDDRTLALFHGLSHVADDCQGQPTRFQLDPLPTRNIAPERLREWFRQFVEVRNADGAERVLLTAIGSGMPAADVCEMMQAAATDHVYLNGGHSLDFVNKGFELLEKIGWEHAPTVLPSLIRALTGATRSEEQNAWRAPVDLIALVRPSLERLEKSPLPLGEGKGEGASFDVLVDALVADDPKVVVGALDDAFGKGAPPTEVSLALCCAAALRVARFGTSNEFGDWIAVLHTLTYCNALHQSLKRKATPEVARGIYHGALRVYLDRFLNVPPARLPSNGRAAPGDLSAELQTLLDRQAQVAAAAQLVDAHIHGDGPDAALWEALGAVLLREDAEFHTYQTYEAGAQLYRELRPDRPERAREVALAVARYVAAHSPTNREMRQTARIAVRLQRGDDLAEEPDDPSEG